MPATLTAKVPKAVVKALKHRARASAAFTLRLGAANVARAKIFKLRGHK